MLQVPVLRPEVFNCLQFGAAALLESAVLTALGVSAGESAALTALGVRWLCLVVQAADCRQQISASRFKAGAHPAAPHRCAGAWHSGALTVAMSAIKN